MLVLSITNSNLESPVCLIQQGSCSPRHSKILGGEILDLLIFGRMPVNIYLLSNKNISELHILAPKAKSCTENASGSILKLVLLCLTRNPIPAIFR